MASKKRVRWSTITIHEFAVGHGGSAVPKSGPSIGLARTPEFTWSTSVGTMASECEGVRRFTSTERAALLREAGFSRERIEAFIDEAADVRKSRELYYSSEMKSFRKKRKKCKAEARAERRSKTKTLPSPSDNTVPTICTTTAASDGTTITRDGANDKPATPTDLLRIKIRILPTTSSSSTSDKLPTSPSMVPPPLPLSPCCS